MSDRGPFHGISIHDIVIRTRGAVIIPFVPALAVLAQLGNGPAATKFQEIVAFSFCTGINSILHGSY